MNNSKKIEAWMLLMTRILIVLASFICFKIGLQSQYTIGVISGIILGLIFLIDILYIMVVLLNYYFGKEEGKKKANELMDEITEMVEEELNNK